MRRITVTIDLLRVAAAVVVVAALLVLAVAARRPITDRLAAALTAEDPLPERAGAVFVHGGGLLVRTPGAVAVARRVGAETIAVTQEAVPGSAYAERYDWRPPTEVDAARRILEVEGWTGGFETVGVSRSTMEDAELLRRWAEARGLRSVVAVTSPPHTRRVRFCLRRAFEGSSVEIRVRSAQSSEDFVAVWPDERDYVQFVWSEAARLLVYRYRY